MHERLRRGIKIAGLVLASLLVCFLISELVFTFAIPASTLPEALFDSADRILRYDPDGRRRGLFTAGRWAQQRGRWQINNAGWNSEIDYKPAGERERPLIALIGDSFVEGLHVDVDETIAAVLRRRLGPAWDVYGFGMSGASLSQYLLMSRYVARHFAPEVMVFIIIHNDLNESLRELIPQDHMLQVSLADGAFSEVAPKPYRPSPVRRLLRRSALVRYVTLNARLAQFVSRIASGGEKRPFRSNVEVEALASERELITRATSFLVGRLRDENPERDLVFVMDALRPDIYAGTLDESPLAWMNDLMAAVCREHAVTFIDLTPPFLAHYRERGEAFNSRIDSHWNEVGHRVAAEVLAERLKTLAILDRVCGGAP